MDATKVERITAAAEAHVRAKAQLVEASQAPLPPTLDGQIAAQVACSLLEATTLETGKALSDAINS